jgi:hypothetical protein
LNYESATLVIAETGEIANSYAANSGKECSFSRFQLGRHTADGNAIYSQFTGGFSAQARRDFAAVTANTFDVNDEEQLIGLECCRDSRSGIVAIHV